MVSSREPQEAFGLAAGVTCSGLPLRRTTVPERGEWVGESSISAGHQVCADCSPRPPELLAAWPGKGSWGGEGWTEELKKHLTHDCPVGDKTVLSP